MASQEFDDNSDEKKPTVQVGDPFAEKLFLEACLELMKTDTHHFYSRHGSCRSNLLFC